MIVKQVGKSQVQVGRTYLVRQAWNVFISKAKRFSCRPSENKMYFDDIANKTIVVLDDVSEIYEIIL